MSGIFSLLASSNGSASTSQAGFGWALLVGVLAYTFAFQVGWGAIPWLYPTEIFPMNVKERAMSTTLASQFLGTLVIQLGVPQMVSFLSPGVTFLTFAGCCAVSSLLVYRLVPETKGVALESMDEVFGSRFSDNAM